MTCKLHDIDPYDYLVDVLQRVGQHPASRAHELTPRMWKQLFADNPLRSPLHQIAEHRKDVGELPITLYQPGVREVLALEPDLRC